MNNKLIFVTYKGGNCGDFFCFLLNKALGNEDLSYQDDTNRCVFKNTAFIDHGIKGLEEVFRRYNKHKYIMAVDQMDRTGLEYLDWTRRIHDFCYDEDRDQFIRNVRDYIAANLHVYDRNTVASIHYYDYFEGFNLSDVYQPSTTIQLITEDPLCHAYFFYLARYKQRFRLIRNAPDWYDFMDDPPMVNKLPYDVTVVDSGKLFFSSSYDDKAESILSNSLGLQIKFDRNVLNAYRESNEKILVDGFGENYRNMSLVEFRTARKKIFEVMRMK